MINWLHSLLPHFPHYGYVLVFIVEFLNNIGVPLPGDTTLLMAGFILGKNAFSLWKPMAAGMAACSLGGIGAFWAGRRMGYDGLKKIHWLHFTPERVRWIEVFFKRHGHKAVFIARFIILFPPVAANLLAGIAKMKWRVFLFYDLTGSAVYATSYILIGYFFGKKWKLLVTWLGPTALYSILGSLALLVLVVVFRHRLYGFLTRIFSGKGHWKVR